MNPEFQLLSELIKCLFTNLQKSQERREQLRGKRCREHSGSVLLGHAVESLHEDELQLVVGVRVDGNLAQNEGHYLDLLEVGHLAGVLSEGVEQRVL